MAKRKTATKTKATRKIKIQSNNPKTVKADDFPDKSIDQDNSGHSSRSNNNFRNFRFDLNEITKLPVMQRYSKTHIESDDLSSLRPTTTKKGPPPSIPPELLNYRNDFLQRIYLPSNLINSRDITQTDTTDLKYLHKKFKRVASTTTTDDDINYVQDFQHIEQKILIANETEPTATTISSSKSLSSSLSSAVASLSSSVMSPNKSSSSELLHMNGVSEFSRVAKQAIETNSDIRKVNATAVTTDKSLFTDIHRDSMCSNNQAKSVNNRNFQSDFDAYNDKTLVNNRHLNRDKVNIFEENTRQGTRCPQNRIDKRRHSVMEVQVSRSRTLSCDTAPPSLIRDIPQQIIDRVMELQVIRSRVSATHSSKITARRNSGRSNENANITKNTIKETNNNNNNNNNVNNTNNSNNNNNDNGNNSDNNENRTNNRSNDNNSNKIINMKSSDDNNVNNRYKSGNSYINNEVDSRSNKSDGNNKNNNESDDSNQLNLDKPIELNPKNSNEDNKENTDNDNEHNSENVNSQTNEISNKTANETIENNEDNLTNENNNNNNNNANNNSNGKSSSSNSNSAPGKYVCSYCKLNCSKPSVLRKHIRAHTNERPYPCEQCGFAFKTRSNLYKHYRSRAHLLRGQGNAKGTTSGGQGQQLDTDEVSQGIISDHEMSSCSTTASSDKISRPSSPIDDQASTSPTFGNPSTSQISANPLNFQQQNVAISERPYKPKFHNAALYHANSSDIIPMMSNFREKTSYDSLSSQNRNKVPESTTVTASGITVPHHPLTSQNVEYLKEHISKIISQNEAIMEVVEPALQKKYHKITGISRGNSFSASSSSDAPVPSAVPTVNTCTNKNPSNLTPAQKYSGQTPLQREEKVTKTEGRSELSVLNIQANVRSKGMPSLKQKAQQVMQIVRQSEAMSPLINRNILPSNQPLNLTADSTVSTSNMPENSNKRPQGLPFASSSTSFGVPINQPLVIETSSQPSTHQNHHPQNPERSIIKSLLLNSRGLAVPTTGEGEDAVYTCPLCKISFRSADVLQYHTKCYCQGTPPVSTQSSGQNRNNSPHSAPISPVGSPSHKYFRSNSFNICLPEKYSPSTLAKLASSSLRHHRTPLSLAKLAAQQTGYYAKRPSIVALATPSGITSASTSSRGRPENINIELNAGHSSSGLTNSNSSCSGHTSTQSVSSQCVQITKQLMDALPSPGPLLGKTRLVDTYNTTTENKREDAIVSNYTTPAISSNSESIANEQESLAKNTKYTSETISPSNRKRQRRDSYTHSPPPKNAATSNDSLLSQKNPRLLQMCGGEIRIFERKGDTTPRFGSSGGSIISISPSPDSISEPSPIGLRAGLLSGGSIIETPSKKTSSSVSPSIQTSDHPTLHTIISTESQIPGGSQKPHLIFQFPPVNAITAFNPLTLPPLNTNEPNKIYYGDKFIPYVPGMPGPNTLSITNQLRSPSPVRKKIVPSSPVAIRAIPNQPNPAHSFFTANKPPFSPHSSSPKSSPKPRPLSLAKTTDDEEKSSAFSNVLSRPTINNSYSPLSFPHPSGLYSSTVFPLKSVDANKKTFNFTRIADNLSPSKTNTKCTDSVSTVTSNVELKCFNFENLIPKPEVIMRTNKQKDTEKVSSLLIDVVSVPTLVIPSSTSTTLPTNSQMSMTSRDSPNAEQKLDTALKLTTKPTKFLRPTTLPLKPGTFSPKRHHGITPTANTLPLISPDTPRPSKTCIQLYLDGHAYTYLGLKCSTKTFYCTVNRPQMVHFTSQSKHPISFYSNWQICEESNPHPLGLSPKEAMSLYDSRQRLQQYRRFGKYTVANKNSKCTTLHSQSLICTAVDTRSGSDGTGDNTQTAKKIEAFVRPESTKIVAPNTTSTTDNCSSISSDSGYQTASAKLMPINFVHTDSNDPSVSSTPTVPGGYESNEDYTYIRGRGRGRYVCTTCGIRCKKPSMLKKHIRTHTDVRPYTCQHCAFSFKTKGNLTKHMKSKTHYKKLAELGLKSLPNSVDEDYEDQEDSSVTSSGGERIVPNADGDDDSDMDDLTDGDDNEHESSDTEEPKFRLHEHEAACSLLSLSQTPPEFQNSMASPNLLIPGHPMTYPYVGNSYQQFTQYDSCNVSPYESQKGIMSSLELSQTYDQHKKNAAHYSKQMHQNCLSPHTDAMPIDLTKPRSETEETERRIKKVVPVLAPVTSTYAGPAGLLSSLMSITEKVPAIVSPMPLPPGDHEFPMLPPLDSKGLALTKNNNDLLESYLTERAMHNSKIKQSQMQRVIGSTIEPYDRNTNSVQLINPKPFVDRTLDTKQSEHISIGRPSDLKASLDNRSSGNNELIEQPNLKQRKITTIQTEEKEKAPEFPNTKKCPMKVPELEAGNSDDTDVRAVVEHDPSKDEVLVSTTTKNTNLITVANMELAETILQIEIPIEVPQHKGADDVGPISGIDTLAEIAASSVKLDTTKPTTSTSPPPLPVAPTENTQKTQVPPIQAQRTNEPEPAETPAQTGTPNSSTSAKTVASEYLKKSIEYMRAFQFSVAHAPSSGDDIVDDSSSDVDTSENHTPRKLSQSSVIALQNISERGSSASASNPLISARTVVVGEDGFKRKSANSSDLPVVTFPIGSSSNTGSVRANPPFIQEDGGRSVCAICSKTFLKKHQMVLHMNIHYMTPRKFRCEPCAVNFRTQGHLQKHERSDAHKTKVIMTTTFGQVTTRNPRPFECSDCKIAFRIHGHLAKHLRSKTHVQKLECLQKLPFGTYAEIERAGISLTDIDTSDCDNSLASLRILAQKLLGDKDSGDDKSNSAMQWDQPQNNFSPADSERERTGSTSEEGELISGQKNIAESDKQAQDNDEIPVENSNKKVDLNIEKKDNECSPDKFKEDSDENDDV